MMRWYWLLVLASLLSACGLPKRVAIEEFNAQHWSLSAKMALRYDQQRLSATLKWQHSPTQQQVYLLDPLGRIIAELTQTQTQATLTLEDGQRVHAQDLTQLMQQQLGWALPFDSLSYWARGKPAPDPEANIKVQQGVASQTFTQHGWSIETFRPDSESLPNKLVLQHPQLSLKLVRIQWQTQ